jgi:hypothetical protein
MEQIYNINNKTRNITTLGLTSITGKFILIAVIINTKGASSNTMKIYDDANGEETPEKLIGTTDTTASIGRIDYGIPIFEGINVRTAVGTAPDLTIIYRPMPSVGTTT